jgi:nucleotide-binding universal stress UspA family protein
MKSILVPVGGSDSDDAVFATAAAVARPLAAHLNFFHVHIGPGQAAIHTPHAGFASGSALGGALKELDTQARKRSDAAAAHVREFCVRSNIAFRETPDAGESVTTASFRQEKDNALERIMFRVRHNDLVVVGRAKKPNGLPLDFLDLLLLGCGRPVLIASTTQPESVTGTIMVCWRESADAARAVTAAMPLLTKAKRVIFASVVEDGGKLADAVKDITAQIAWSGVAAEAKVIPPHGAPLEELLAATAKEIGADLIVMGAYGHSRIREVLFGGCTRAFITHADRPVLLMH